MQNKVTILSNAKALAFSSGDLDRMNAIENDLLGTQNTLSQLQMLLDATRAANTSSLDVASVLSAGVQAAQAASAIPDAPTAVLADYDISTYAADPAYLQKITDMLTAMPNLDNTTQIDVYIDREVVGSPITGQMVVDATTKYAVDTRLTCAIMELDSRFGTAGVGAQTFNPGNVGNTGTSTQTYASWSDGVAAVAYWLSKHRTGGPVPVTPAPINAVPNTAATDTVVATTTPATTLPTTDVITTTATSTPSVATSTTPFVPLPIVPPPVPVITIATSTDPVTVTVTASSTDAVGTTTLTTTTATSTESTSISTTTPDVTASSTSPVLDLGTASSTAASASTTDTTFIDTASTTQQIISPAATSTTATSTPDVTASSTQARGNVTIKRRRV